MDENHIKDFLTKKGFSDKVTDGVHYRIRNAKTLMERHKPGDDLSRLVKEGLHEDQTGEGKQESASFHGGGTAGESFKGPKTAATPGSSALKGIERAIKRL